MKIKFKLLTKAVVMLISIMLLFTACDTSDGGASDDTPANNTVSDNDDAEDNNEIDTDDENNDTNNDDDPDNPNSDDDTDSPNNDDDLIDEDDIVVEEPDMFEGYWIHTYDKAALILDGYGSYMTWDDMSSVTNGEYKVEGDTLYFLGDHADTWIKAHITDDTGRAKGGLIVDGYPWGGWFEREVPIYEAQNLVYLSDDELVGEWTYLDDGYTCNIYDDGTFTLDEHDGYYTGTYYYDGEELSLTTDDDEYFYGYFGEINDVAVLYIYGYVGHYSNVANVKGPDTTTHYSGIYGEWYEDVSGITLSLFDNGAYRIKPEGAVEGIPSEGDLVYDYIDMIMYELGATLTLDDTTERVGTISLFIDGEHDGKITIRDTELYFSKIGQTPEGDPPSIVPDDGSAFSNLEIPILIEDDGKRYTVDNGAATFSRDEDFYENAFADYTVEVLSDESDGTLRTVALEVSAYIPAWSVGWYAPTDLNFSFFFDFFDYQYGYVLPTTSAYIDDSVYTFDMPNYDGVEISLIQEQDMQIEDKAEEAADRITQKLYVTVTMPADYKNLVLGFMPLPSTQDAFDNLMSSYDNFQLGTSFEDLGYNLHGAMYYRFD